MARLSPFHFKLFFLGSIIAGAVLFVLTMLWYPLDKERTCRPMVNAAVNETQAYYNFYCICDKSKMPSSVSAQGPEPWGQLRDMEKRNSTLPNVPVEIE